MPSAWQAVATMFVTTLNTDCSLVRKLYAAGYEIADHTITHPHVSLMGRLSADCSCDTLPFCTVC